MAIDYDFIKTLEGRQIIHGYVPNKNGEVLGHSGVTIASGVDLGQWKTLADFNLPDSIVEQLTPYLGVTGQAALEFIQKNPLTMTNEDVDVLQVQFEKVLSKQLEHMYNLYSKVDFSQIPSAAQTVIFSVFYQYGNLPVKTPNFWKTVVSQDWDKVVSELQNFGDAYSVRRNQEANYLKNNLTN